VQRFYGTIHLLSENPGFPPIAEGEIDILRACPGVIRLELEGRPLLHVSEELAEGFYAGMQFTIPGGRLLRLHASAEEVAPLAEVWETSLQRMQRDLERILSGEAA
jgi:hypothetical protein